MPDRNDPRRRAEDLIEFCDGFDDAVLIPELTRRSRMVARDLLDLLVLLEGTQSALVAMTADRDRWRENRWQARHGEAWPT